MSSPPRFLMLPANRNPATINIKASTTGGRALSGHVMRIARVAIQATRITMITALTIQAGVTLLSRCGGSGFFMSGTGTPFNPAHRADTYRWAGHTDQVLGSPSTMSAM